MNINIKLQIPVKIMKIKKAAVIITDETVFTGPPRRVSTERTELVSLETGITSHHQRYKEQNL